MSPAAREHILTAMKNQEIADIFNSIADLMEILGEDHFRINSYRKSARVIEELAEPIETFASAGRLTEIPGVGKSTAEKIAKYLETGKVELYEELKAKVPPHLPELLAVGGLGPKTVAKLWKKADIKSVEELKAALTEHPERITGIEGLGPKKAEQMLAALQFMDSAGGRIRLGEADALAAELIDIVKKCKGARRVVVAGSLRRGKETIGDIDVLAEASKAAAGEIIKTFTTSPKAARVLAEGETKGSIITSGGVQSDLRVVETKSFGAAMNYFTGSREHNVRLREIAISKGMKLNEYGLFEGEKLVAGKSEEELYAALGMDYVPPELREDRGEIQAAIDHRLPKLLEAGDIRGDLHMHTVASDGVNTIDEMIDACRDRGYKYMAIADHSQSQIQAHGLDAERLAGHVKAIRAAAAKRKDIAVLASIEVDIFKDGSLDFPPDVLATLDLVTASPHSALAMEGEAATQRIIRAIEQPHVHCIGHPSGRLINRRAGMEIDIEKIARAAAANGVALEINAHYWRLDLRDVHVRAAIEAGAKIVINSDAHEIAGLDMMHYGVTTARRGWATAADVINAWPLAKLKKFLAQKS